MLTCLYPGSWEPSQRRSDPLIWASDSTCGQWSRPMRPVSGVREPRHGSWLAGFVAARTHNLRRVSLVKPSLGPHAVIAGQPGLAPPIQLAGCGVAPEKPALLGKMPNASNSATASGSGRLLFGGSTMGRMSQRENEFHLVPEPCHHGLPPSHACKAMSRCGGEEQLPPQL